MLNINRLQKYCEGCYIEKVDVDGLVYGSLSKKKGADGDYHYAIIGLAKRGPDGASKRAQKWIPLRLKAVRGNQRQAEAMLYEIRKLITEYISNREQITAGNGRIQHNAAVLPETMTQSDSFIDYIMKFHKAQRPKETTKKKTKKKELALTTYASQESRINAVLLPYFEKLGIRLQDVTTEDIETYYEYLREVRDNSERTVLHHHNLLNKIFKYARLNRDILINPMDLVVKPDPEAYEAEYYRSSDVNRLLERLTEQNHWLLTPVLLAAYYGLRRSEVVGLKWDAFNFEDVDEEKNIYGSFTIEHTFHEIYYKGKKIKFGVDNTKNKSSHRTMPLSKNMRDMMLDIRKQQENMLTSVESHITGSTWCTFVSISLATF